MAVVFIVVAVVGVVGGGWCSVVPVPTLRFVGIRLGGRSFGLSSYLANGDHFPLFAAVRNKGTSWMLRDLALQIPYLRMAQPRGF